ncbi:peptide-methionine (S)-S-oxide reductase MsrA [Aquirhabdus parva]|uniref:Peptide methionine sulfoxide reductase MsrA n=1 Tax=Aquirhabdus parva TaxID=2283318 RepID=A0A345P2N0_9GAMM|nr:peptide-methionine (S)-S-oxide reductase MsrA [Aquirhabdus parva]AXI01539.1 peptide-methionine (S)-S-oxide reductase [Aquirhabdus parva]
MTLANPSDALSRAIVGGGCFWCSESVFRAVRGVHAVVSGYAGGARPNPSYEQVCTGATGHAEVIAIDFDPTQISYERILDIFFATHDPTSLNRQGNDIGTQYRSVIFYENDAQKDIAAAKIAELKANGVNVVTELSPAPTFYRAEEYHQNFYEKNPEQGYCTFAIPPKLAKLKQYFSEETI